MARPLRIKVENGEGWYHVTAKVNDYVGHYALEHPECQEKLIDVMSHYASAYYCKVAAFCVMGNHWHLVIHFDAPRELSREELAERLLRLFPKRGRAIAKTYTEKDWCRLSERLFDLSEFMRNVQAVFALWYNETYVRSGSLWQDRFRSTLLGDEEALLDCMLYVDLNPVRAGITTRPESHKACSLHYREKGPTQHLMPLQDLLGEATELEALRNYRARAYHRGNIPTREGQARIPDKILQDEEKRGFRMRGTFLSRMRHLTDGLVLGTADFIREYLLRLKEQGRYHRRVNPVQHLGGKHHTLREQRGLAPGQ